MAKIKPDDGIQYNLETIKVANTLQDIFTITNNCRIKFIGYAVFKKKLIGNLEICNDRSLKGWKLCITYDSNRNNILEIALQSPSDVKRYHNLEKIYGNFTKPDDLYEMCKKTNDFSLEPLYDESKPAIIKCVVVNNYKDFYRAVISPMDDVTMDAIDLNIYEPYYMPNSEFIHSIHVKPQFSDTLYPFKGGRVLVIGGLYKVKSMSELYLQCLISRPFSF